MAAKIQHLSHRVLVVVLLLALGAAPILVQSMAWGLMLMEYSRANTITTAIGMTFDGRHPCAVCHKVQKQEQGERKQQTLLITREIVLFHEETVLCLTPMESIWQPQTRGHNPASLVTRAQKPPLPPPRSCA